MPLIAQNLLSNFLNFFKNTRSTSEQGKARTVADWVDILRTGDKRQKQAAEFELMNRLKKHISYGQRYLGHDPDVLIQVFTDAFQKWLDKVSAEDFVLESSYDGFFVKIFRQACIDERRKMSANKYEHKNLLANYEDIENAIALASESTIGFNDDVLEYKAVLERFSVKNPRYAELMGKVMFKQYKATDFFEEGFYPTLGSAKSSLSAARKSFIEFLESEKNAFKNK
jgi:hypothetical protein